MARRAPKRPAKRSKRPNPAPKPTPLGTRLRYARGEAGFSQKALGDRAGVTGAYVCLLERGWRSNPRARELEAIAGALGVTATWLLHGEPTPDVASIRRAGEEARAEAAA